MKRKEGKTMKTKGKMRVAALLALVLLISMTTACKDGGGREDSSSGSAGLQTDQVDLEKHKATDMQAKGIWSERAAGQRFDDEGKPVIESVSINEYKDMSEDDRMQILDYYEKLNAQQPMTLYVQFFQGDSATVIKKYKYADGKTQESTDEEQSYFLNPYEVRTEGEDAK